VLWGVRIDKCMFAMGCYQENLHVFRSGWTRKRRLDGTMEDTGYPIKNIFKRPFHDWFLGLQNDLVSGPPKRPLDYHMFHFTSVLVSIFLLWLVVNVRFETNLLCISNCLCMLWNVQLLARDRSGSLESTKKHIKSLSWFKRQSTGNPWFFIIKIWGFGVSCQNLPSSNPRVLVPS
jgi:hypothetical protein